MLCGDHTSPELFPRASLVYRVVQAKKHLSGKLLLQRRASILVSFDLRLKELLISLSGISSYVWQVSWDRQFSGPLVRAWFHPVLRNAGFHSTFKVPPSKFHIKHVISVRLHQIYFQNLMAIYPHLLCLSNKLPRLHIYVVYKDNVINISFSSQTAKFPHTIC